MQEIPYDASHVPIEYDDPIDVKEDEKRLRREQRASLEKDVAQLQKKLMIEVKMRDALNRGLSRPLGSLPRIYATLPVETRELLLEVAVLEEEIISLEKQVVHLGREIENEAPVTDKEAIGVTPHQLTSPKKENISGSPSVSPKDSSRINSKPSVPIRKSSDQRSNLSKPSLPAGKITENKNSPGDVSISPRKPLDGGSSVNCPTSLKDSSKPRRTITLAPPQKSQIQTDGLLPNVTSRNSRDVKSRRISFTKKETHGFSSSAISTGTLPFVPKSLGFPKEGDHTTPPVSPATGGPTDVGKSFARPSRINTEDDKPPITGHAQIRRKCSINDKVAAPTSRTLRATSTPKPPGKEKGPEDTAKRTLRLPRQKHKSGSTATRRIVGDSTALKQQSIDPQESSATPDTGSTTPTSSSNPQIEFRDPVDAEADEHDANNADILSTGMADLEQNSVLLSPGHVKASRQTCSPEKDKKLKVEQVTDSVLLSKQVVKLLKTIYGNLQEKQPPLACDSGSSSQASISASVSSASPDDYEMRSGLNIESSLKESHSESLRTKRSAGMRFLEDSYPGEATETLDPYSFLSRGGINNRIGFHERLMS